MQNNIAPKLNAKDVKDKLTFTEISPNFLISLSKVSNYGKLKYGSDKHGDYIYGDVEEFLNALFRHYVDWFTSGPVDSDSGLHHAEHMAWNMLAIIDVLYYNGELTNNGSRKETAGQGNLAP